MNRILLFLALALLGATPAQADLRGDLKARMARWEALLQQTQTGLLNGNVGQIERAAAALAETPPLPEPVSAVLEAHLTKREAEDYAKIDAYIATTGQDLQTAAADEDVQKMLVYQGRLVMSCVQCHEIFRRKATNALQAAGQ